MCFISWFAATWRSLQCFFSSSFSLLVVFCCITWCTSFLPSSNSSPPRQSTCSFQTSYVSSPLPLHGRIVIQSRCPGRWTTLSSHRRASFLLPGAFFFVFSFPERLLHTVFVHTASHSTGFCLLHRTEWLRLVVSRLPPPRPSHSHSYRPSPRAKRDAPSLPSLQGLLPSLCHHGLDLQPLQTGVQPRQVSFSVSCHV